MYRFSLENGSMREHELMRLVINAAIRLHFVNIPNGQHWYRLGRQYRSGCGRGMKGQIQWLWQSFNLRLDPLSVAHLSILLFLLRPQKVISYWPLFTEVMAQAQQ